MTDTETGIIVRAFIESGKDGEDGMITYIDKLERLILWQDKELTGRRNRRSRLDIHALITQAERQKVLK